MKFLRHVISIMLILLLLLSFSSISAANNADLPELNAENATIEDFVERMFSDVLGRDYNKLVFDYWVYQLENGATGASVAYSFLFGNEFLRKNVSDYLYIDVLYKALWNHPSDVKGISNWVYRLNTGWTREDVFAEFVNSAEFEKLCKEAGIIRGKYDPPPRRMSRVFVSRLYWTTMRKHPDIRDLDFWHSTLEMGTPVEVVTYNFIFSDDMNDRNLTDSRFIGILYQALLDREVTTEERVKCENRLENGETRFNLYTSVINSSEFKRICNTFDITKRTTPLIAESVTDNKMVDIIWNHIRSAGFSGISDSPEHIAGIIGNMKSEAGPALCPFQIQVGNHRGLGLMQWTNPSRSSGGRRTNMEEYMWQNGVQQDAFLEEMNKHLTRYCSHPTSLHPQDLLERVIEAQIQFMFHELRNTWERQYVDYMSHVAGATGTVGARAYAELFCAMALRPGDGGRFNTVEDPGVLNALGASPWSSRTSYSALALRRDRAEAVYHAFLNN